MKINADFYLPSWEDGLNNWRDLNTKLSSILLGIHGKDPRFSHFYNLFKTNPSFPTVINALKEDVESVLPFAFLSHSNTVFFERYYSEDCLEVVLKRGNEINSHIRGLLQKAYISNLQDNKNQFSEKLLNRLFTYPEHTSNSQTFLELKLLGLFSQLPCSNFAQIAVDKGKHPELLLDELSLHIAPNSRFIRTVKLEYLLKRLERSDFKKESELTQEITLQKLFDLEYSDNHLLGHQIIRTILNKVDYVDLDQTWIELILNFAGDPRTSTTSRNYIKWWSRIDQTLIAKFIQILSHGDILLFLNAFNDFAKQNDPNMERMFKSRKTFLTGLSIQNKIEKSRLFLPIQIKLFIEKKYPSLDLSYVCDLRGAQSAIIYLKMGRFHIFEGTHSCRLRIYEEYPSQLDVLDPDFKEVYYQYLTTGMEEQYYERYLKDAFTTTHHANGQWKKDAVEELLKSEKFDVNQLLTDEERNVFRNWVQWKTK